MWSQAIVGTTVYVTGSFTKARPPGVPVGGAGEIAAQNIFAYDVTTGNPVANFSHALNAQGLVVRASADGSRVYVGGDFTTVDGAARGHVAAFSTATGALLSWAPNIGGQVRALAVTDDTVYVGGNYPVGQRCQARIHLAAFRVSNAQMTDWAPVGRRHRRLRLDHGHEPRPDPGHRRRLVRDAQRRRPPTAWARSTPPPARPARGRPRTRSAPPASTAASRA